VHNDLIVKQHAPGLVIGLSGTDSILAFLICAKAFQRIGRPERLVGIHYGTDYGEAEWLRSQAPGSPILIDSTIAEDNDGLRWGSLMEFSVRDPHTQELRSANDRFWVVGTMNKTESVLLNFSNLSQSVSVQLLAELWKSEILELCRYLGVPMSTIAKSCQADCACGRDDFAAAHIPELDWVLMAQRGTLAPAFLQKHMPSALRVQLESYAKTQIESAAFKRDIPYRPSLATVALKADNWKHQLDAIQKNGDLKAATEFAKATIIEGNSVRATEFVTELAPRWHELLPEMWTLFSVNGLRLSQKQKMLETIFQGPFHLELPLLARLTHLSARLGLMGFVFPQWRFLTQRAGLASTLAERHGFERLTRSTDVRDPSLPLSNPQRDLWGPGFVWRSPEWYIEFRRAYLLCSHFQGPQQSTLLIRNNSHYFGRDRLPEPVLVSESPMTAAQLQALLPEDLTRSTQWIPWQNVLSLENPSKTLESVQGLLKKIDQVQNDFSDWLLFDPSGFTALKELIATSLAKGSADRPVFYLGLVKKGSASWNPRSVLPMDSLQFERLKNGNRLSDLFPEATADEKVVLMNGPMGD
jgi:NH3-dependent NAD+ synthetase